MLLNNVPYYTFWVNFLNTATHDLEYDNSTIAINKTPPTKRGYFPGRCLHKTGRCLNTDSATIHLWAA